MKNQFSVSLIIILLLGVLFYSFLLTESVNGAPSIDVVNSQTSPVPSGSLLSNSDFAILGTNSTLSEHIFNNETCKISFNVSGPLDTSGYIWCKISENLIPNHDNFGKTVSVFLDGERIYYMYTFYEGSWQLYFNYTHNNTQEVVISFPKQTWTLLAWTIPIAAIIIVSIAILIIRYKKRNITTANSNKSLA